MLEDANHFRVSNWACDADQQEKIKFCVLVYGHDINASAYNYNKIAHASFLNDHSPLSLSHSFALLSIRPSVACVTPFACINPYRPLLLCPGVFHVTKNRPCFDEGAVQKKDVKTMLRP